MSDRTNTAFSPNCSGSPTAANYCDGRTPNFWTITSSGTAVFAGNGLPQVAQYRQNMAPLNTGFNGRNGGPFTSFVCTHRDATLNIGCLVGNTTCTTGMAGLLQATAPVTESLNVPLKLAGAAAHPNTDPTYGDYGMTRNLWLNAIGGFANLTEHCANDLLNESATYCQDQVELTNWFRNPHNAAAACMAGDFSPIFAAGTTEPIVECVGAALAPLGSCGSTGYASWDLEGLASATACLAD